MYAAPLIPALKVLWVGNSLTYVKSLPCQFAYLCKQCGRPLKLAQVVEPGQTFCGHYNRGRAQELLRRSGPWDYVILQEQSTTPVADRASMNKYGQMLAAQARELGTKPVLLMTWADKGEFQTQKQVSEAYRNLGRKLNALVIPDGDLWFTAQQQFPSLELYSKDRHHPNGTGSYVGALLTFCMLTGEKPDNAPARVPSNSAYYGLFCDLNNSDHAACIKLVKDCLSNNGRPPSEPPHS